MSMRVLIVEDDDDFGLLLSAMITKSGREPFRGRDAVQGMRLFVEKEPDLVIVDYRMPGKNGIELARDLKEVRSDLPIILLSGFLTEDLRFLAERVGIDRILSKPITYRQIQIELDRIEVVA